MHASDGHGAGGADGARRTDLLRSNDRLARLRSRDGSSVGSVKSPKSPICWRRSCPKRSRSAAVVRRASDRTASSRCGFLRSASPCWSGRVGKSASRRRGRRSAGGPRRAASISVGRRGPATRLPERRRLVTAAETRHASEEGLEADSRRGASRRLRFGFRMVAWRIRSGVLAWIEA